MEEIRSYTLTDNVTGDVDYYKKCIELQKENNEYKNIIEIIEYETTKSKENEKKLQEELSGEKQKSDYLNNSYKQLTKENSDLQKINEEIKNIMEVTKYEKNESIENGAKLQEELSIIKQKFNHLYEAYEQLSKQNAEDRRIDEIDEVAMGNNNKKKIIKIKDLKNLNRELVNKNRKLMKEASYQTILGDGLKFRISDDHEDNSAHLATDVITVLQRYILEQVLKWADDYFEVKEHDDLDHPSNQEKYIVNHTNQLLDFLNNQFYPTNFIQDNSSMVIKDIPTKIRQFTYLALTELGFSGTEQEHSFISRTAKKLNRLMTRYRVIKDENKRKNVEDMAEGLVKEIVRIFKFLLLVQEPKCKVHWFTNNAKLDFRFMKVLSWDDGNVDDYVMEICFFPFIGIMDSDGNPSKLITHARVYPRNITNPQETQDMSKNISSAVSENLLQSENLQDAE
ncbi:13185_t:CDS:2 [Entrophospora sp. SA101]|nr:13185_t:CDS:2 [Entrophospora sp. SA101]CAJ0901778.1 22439_t:CDS:2 [Entrophospora sp. SA101]CAJ0901826.1 22447_t:CDS:2 [Entrophospora sp. SA101]